ncbi:MAG: PEP-utilizing enzyme [Candidatus Woesearchaeota archaeon]
MNTTKLLPSEYEYLWTDHDINFIFTSCYLFKKFRETDIVLIYDWKNKALKFFLSKKEKKKFADYAMELYEKHFDRWRSNINNCIEQGKKIIKETKDDNPRLLGNEQLKNKIIERVNLFQELAGNYFCTEFFFMGKVEKSDSKVIRKNLETMGKIKYQAREILNNFYNYKTIFMPYIEEIAKRTKRKDLQWLSFQEIIDLLESMQAVIFNQVPNPNQIPNFKQIPISDRDKQYWVLSKNNDWKMIVGDEAKEIMDAFDKRFINNNVNAITGIIANKGIYQGTAKVVRTFFSDKAIDEIKKVEKGDVLIAETTGPEMMIACEKAGAIVTDEGGLTSHAAIVSRELGIPCIVGTKNATKVLKDGDVVEVDAETGVVRKINKICSF